jgi:hypothetical protein
VILGFYAGKSHNLIGLRIFHGDLDYFDLQTVPRYTQDNLEIKKDHEKSLDLSNYDTRDNLEIKKDHEKSLDLSNYEIFPHKILKSRTFKKSSMLIVIMQIRGQLLTLMRIRIQLFNLMRIRILILIKSDANLRTLACRPSRSSRAPF